MENNQKFIYGMDVENYINKAVEKMKETYHWADKSLFNDQHRYAIELENDNYQFVKYTQFTDSTDREVIDDAEEFIKIIINDNYLSVFYNNKKVKTYKIQFESERMIDRNWYLEKYEFNKLQTGDFSVFIQAGYGREGAGNDFFIPPYCFVGDFDEFLNKFTNLFPGESYGLFKEDFINDKQLKSFLGF